MSRKAIPPPAISKGKRNKRTSINHLGGVFFQKRSADKFGSSNYRMQKTSYIAQCGDYMEQLSASRQMKKCQRHFDNGVKRSGESNDTKILRICKKAVSLPVLRTDIWFNQKT